MITELMSKQYKLSPCEPVGSKTT